MREEAAGAIIMPFMSAVAIAAAAVDAACSWVGSFNLHALTL